jgi:hypothetical protein
MDKLPSLNYGHCLVNLNRFGVDIAHFVVVDVRVLSVFWYGACFGAGVRLGAGLSENSGRKIWYLTLMNSMRASLNNIRSVQVRCIFHALRKALKKLLSVKSFCSSSLQT